MSFNMEGITTKITEVIEEATQSDMTTGVLAKITTEIGDEAADFAKLIMGKVMSMSAEIAEDMSKQSGAPALAVVGEAHASAMAHMAILMLAAGWAMKTEQYAAAENLTDADIDNAIQSILGGSNQ